MNSEAMQPVGVEQKSNAGTDNYLVARLGELSALQAADITYDVSQVLSKHGVADASVRICGAITANLIDAKANQDAITNAADTAGGDSRFFLVEIDADSGEDLDGLGDELEELLSDAEVKGVKVHGPLGANLEDAIRVVFHL